jgi:hypothetical protein
MATKKTAQPVQEQTSAHTGDRHHEALVAAITTDKHAGQGGSYVFDPVTGERELVQELPAAQVSDKQ